MFHDATEWIGRLKRREISSEALLSSYLHRIRTYDPTLRCYITLCEEDALEAARKADERLAQGAEPGVLHGLPIAVKDFICTAGTRTTAGSNVLERFVPAEHATLWRRLEQAGALLLGKLNMHEFGWGATSDNPHYGDCRNPWELARSAGGSSGGCAAAVAADLTPVTVGSDTGGSIRVPAACCGVYGLKPTYGVISLHGVIPMAPSLDHVGPMARSVRDLALMMNVLSGYDPRDPNSVRAVRQDYSQSLDMPITDGTVAIGPEPLLQDADPEFIARLLQAADVLRQAGAMLHECDSIPELREGPQAMTVIARTESLLYHDERLKNPDSPYREGLRQRIEKGRQYSALDYAAAEQARRRLRRSLEQAFERFDVMLTPTMPVATPLLGRQQTAGGAANQPAPRSGHFNRFTNIFNLAGFPAVSVPCGVSSSGLPIGIQLIAAPFQEAKLLQYARQLELAFPLLSPPGMERIGAQS
ncbi:Glutamyl-tRNA(Gln) amidotransferase subunit A [Paenibacillus solanacearum]|uniref:Glutamyl-tRNA(Gln) amidotransferase subunit A n=1 Tax=Paenibacillus solanacearum TaxID=2048548 RepID=A0A916K675_9BACL|nr:amidase [Paenibacillus solanacearum]CAG7632958.1 Glutamyl-tRNA(Gln) amidotransferase subunit A [Paenibacillus solanacearum]